VQGDKLVLAAPLKLQKANTQIAPKVVKAKIDQPKIEKGWANISDPNTKAKLEQKFKTENPQNVPKPSIQPAGANVNALASPGVSPFERGKGKHKGEQLENQAAASVAPGTSTMSTAMPFEQGHGKKGKSQRVESEPGASVPAASSPVGSFEQGKGKHKGQRFENERGASVGTSPAESIEQGKGKKGRGQRFENEPGTSGGSSPVESSDQGKGKNKGHRDQGEQTPGLGGPQNPNGNLQNQNSPEGGKHKGNRQQESFQPGSQNVEGGPGGGGGKRREQIQSQGQPQGGQYGQQGAQGGQQGGGGGKHREQIQSQGPPQGGQYGQQGQQGGGQGKGKGKKGETSPTPSPR